MRNLVVVLGDQLDLDAAAFDGFDASQDAVWMAEAAEESTHVWSTQPRIAVFLAGYCAGCRYNPAARTGDDACPFTTLYWDFLARQEARLSKNTRMAMQVKNLSRLDAAERTLIALRATALRQASEEAKE